MSNEKSVAIEGVVLHGDPLTEGELIAIDKLEKEWIDIRSNKHRCPVMSALLHAHEAICTYGYDCETEQLTGIIRCIYRKQSKRLLNKRGLSE